MSKNHQHQVQTQHDHQQHDQHSHNQHEPSQKQHQSEHEPKHDHSGHHGHMVEDFKKRFFISLLVTIPILLLSPMIQDFMGVNWRFAGDLYLLFALSSFIFFYGGWPFLIGVKDEFKTNSQGMMTLIALAISVAYFYSSAAVIFKIQGHELFWELATLIVIMLLGHWIEMRSVLGASRALEELVKIMPQKAHLVDDEGNIHEVPVNQLKSGNIVLVKPGEKLPADGIIIKGSSSVDESMLTGESVPADKDEKDQVIGGSINGEGSLTIAIQKTGGESYLAQVITMVKEAQESKSKTQDLANRAAKWLFYIAVVAGGTTFAVWTSLGYGFPFAIERMVTVMIIACPHALGLAVPLVTSVSTSLAAKKGLLIRNRINFEGARNLNAVVFDKTGTLTKGEFGITDIIIERNYDENNVLTLAAALEAQSGHPIAKGIVQEAKQRGLPIRDPDTFTSLTGKGLVGQIEGREVKVVSPGYMKEHKLDYPLDKYAQISAQGKTVVFVLIDNQLAGMLGLADKIRETSLPAIRKLKEMGVQSIMLTGDNKQVANWVGQQLQLDQIIAEVLPHEKADKIKQLQEKGLKVAMTGDGVNDAPALATADLGIAVGAGTDVAIETADVILVRSNPEDVVSILQLSKSTYGKMVQNLWWATGYNIVAIPLAAGVLYQAGILLSPAMGAVLMSLSTVIVAINAKLLKV